VDAGFKLADIPAMTMTSTTAGWSSRLLSILRIVSGLLFVEHGTQKVLGFPPGTGPHPGFNLSSMVGVSGALELIGGTLLIIGLFTRVAAFILSGEMAVAYFMVHSHNGLYPIVNKGELAILYCFVFLYLAVAGGGPWSIDHMRRRG
jgi:putative oxidoreductase